jgi:hypothetical protein
MPEQRRIAYTPNPDQPDQRWEGTVRREDNAHRDQVWRGPHVEAVIRQMDKALGPLPEAEYQVQG